MTARPHRAFTLLEVALAISLAVGLLGAAIGFSHYAGSVRDRIKERTQLVLSHRSVMRRITGELRCAMGLPRVGLGVVGKRDRITFLTAGVPGRAAWIKQNVLDKRIPPESDLRLVSYRQAVRTDDEDNEYVVGIERTCQKLIDAPVSQEGKNILVALIAQELKYLRFAYFDGRGWTESWDVRQGLPPAVEITLGDEPLDEELDAETADEEDYTGQAFHRVVYLPLSTVAAEGGTIRGLGGRGQR